MSSEYKRSAIRAQRLFERKRFLSTRSGRIEFLNQRREQSPKMIVARITANTANFFTLVDQHKQWCEPLDFNEGEIWGHRPVDVDTAQRCPLPFRCFRVNRCDLAVECLTPSAAGLFEHHKFRGPDVCQRRDNKHRGEKRTSRKKFQDLRRADQLLLSLKQRTPANIKLARFISQKWVESTQRQGKRSAVSKRQQIIERPQLDQDTVQEVGVASAIALGISVRLPFAPSTSRRNSGAARTLSLAIPSQRSRPAP